jgi:VWFA-related protein
MKGVKWARAVRAVSSSVVVAVLAVAQTVPSGETKPGSAPIAVFRAESRLVIVDVVATDKKGAPLRGLKASDFTLFEDGQAREIKQFEEHVASLQPEASAVAMSLPPQPPNTFTNTLPTGNTGLGLTVVLMDWLNTPLPDQQFARQQLQQTLMQLPPGTPVALLVM